MSPYRSIAVAAPQTGHLLGMVTETQLATLLFDAPTEAHREVLRRTPVVQILEPSTAHVADLQRAHDAFRSLEAHNVDVLPVLDFEQRYVGLISRSDLVEELVRPNRPPLIGGMATPMGVYLTTGAVSGGASAFALAATGLLMFTVQCVSTILLNFLLSRGSNGTTLHSSIMVHVMTSTIHSMPEAIVTLLAPVWIDLVSVIGPFALLLIVLRLSPLSGYHAAEHQVVHAIERFEPLTVERVRAMPRVHPRCGTNLVAGGFICLTIGTALQTLIARWAPAFDEFGYVFGAIVALAYWRSLGSYLQARWTTRPATVGEIESGIRAAREVLERHGQVNFALPRPYVRLWRLGLVQMVSGYIFGYALLILAMRFFPTQAWLKPLLPS